MNLWTPVHLSELWSELTAKLQLLQFLHLPWQELNEEPSQGEKIDNSESFSALPSLLLGKTALSTLTSYRIRSQANQFATG